MWGDNSLIGNRSEQLAIVHVEVVITGNLLTEIGLHRYDRRKRAEDCVNAPTLWLFRMAVGQTPSEMTTREPTPRHLIDSGEHAFGIS